MAEADETMEIRDPPEDVKELWRSLYHEGASLSITQHRPPTPFGAFGYTGSSYPREKVERLESEDGRNMEWCNQWPISETKPVEDAQQRHLEIVSLLAAAPNRQSQVVKCRVDGDPEMLVAKIFDPMFWPEYGADVTFEADSSYSMEAAVYEDLREHGHDGELTPKYFGSWTFEVPTNDAAGLPAKRNIRMILMEYVDAPDIDTILEKELQQDIPDEERLWMMREILKAHAILLWYNILHLDLGPANILLRGYKATEVLEQVSARDRGVVIVGFRMSSSKWRDNSKFSRSLEDKPIKPVYWYWRCLPI
ncbi:unnamed protein product [Clonostachys rosea f. rosea IK726]|uniref:Uncharacterized protein n=1 Tax=Clonostachys rosea f. rosea IK726 TaxID=1349383 RepID=A0ACA9UDN8_BIOOC|nr:unnamed protein product [Clonostachys rosea f. rosea IK726]